MERGCREMKRKIKFRGKCNGIWRKGDHLTYADSEVIKQWSGSISPEYTVEPETVGQFTGEYDMDGTEIYEGDICDVVGTYVVVMWDENYLKLDFFYFDKKKAVFNFEKGVGKIIKVIGNIFDNPEFLKRGCLE